MPPRARAFWCTWACMHGSTAAAVTYLCTLALRTVAALRGSVGTMQHAWFWVPCMHGSLTCTCCHTSAFCAAACVVCACHITCAVLHAWPIMSARALACLPCFAQVGAMQRFSPRTTGYIGTLVGLQGVVVKARLSRSNQVIICCDMHGSTLSCSRALGMHLNTGFPTGRMYLGRFQE